MTPNQLPPLPEPHIGLPWRHNAPDGSIHSSAFTSDQMHAYALAALAQQAQPVDRPIDPEVEINAAWSVIGAEQGSPRSVAFRDGAHWQRGQETKSLSDTSNQKAQEPFAYMDDDVAAGVLEGSVLLSAAIRGAPGGTFNFPLYTRPQQAQEPVANDRDCPHCNYTGSMHCGDVAKTHGGILNPEDCSHAKLFGNRITTPPAPQAALIEQTQEPVAWLYVDTIGERYLCFSRPTGGGAIANLYTTPPAPQVPAPVDELAEFEASMREKHGWEDRDFQSDSFGYFDGHTATAWLAWQARAALQSPAPQTKGQP